ncbi:MAG: hypothetical protein LBT16_04695 [Treponema sp.]|jgi:hypothetical protein|nr:hypothetical protein [Treponema sp.]
MKAGGLPAIAVSGKLIGIALGALLLSCASARPFTHVDDLVYTGEWEDSIDTIEKNKKTLYRNTDTILYYLDKGMISHYAQNYEDSISYLQDSERAIEDAYTKSVTMEIGSYILNDKTREYDGEDYEDIYINAFNALNYYHLNNLEDALVEIRRMNNKLQFLSSKYGIIMSNLQKQALQESTEIPKDKNIGTTRFSDSALARYLGLLFYRGIGQWDDARIDQNYLKVAFANAPHVYRYSMPSSVNAELNIPQDKARLNVIGFSGMSPVKEEEIIRFPLPGARYLKIALPVIVSRPSPVSRIEVRVHTGERFNLELLEDIDAVARETFKDKAEVIYTKSVLRGIIKGTASSALSIASEEVGGDTGLLLGLISMGTQVLAEASELADLRISRYFPAKAWVGGVNLAPGAYTVTVYYYSANGKLLASQTKDMEVQLSALNLMETACLR